MSIMTLNLVTKSTFWYCDNTKTTSVVLVDEDYRMSYCYIQTMSIRSSDIHLLVTVREANRLVVHEQCHYDRNVHITRGNASKASVDDCEGIFLLLYRNKVLRLFLPGKTPLLVVCSNAANNLNFKHLPGQVILKQPNIVYLPSNFFSPQAIESS